MLYTMWKWAPLVMSKTAELHLIHISLRESSMSLSVQNVSTPWAYDNYPMKNSTQNFNRRA
jgi:hypothetical protein